MTKFFEGENVIAATGQAGTVVTAGENMSVLLANGDIWHGFASQCRYPQDAEDLAACPLDVDKFKDR